MSPDQIDRFDESGRMEEEWPEHKLLGAMRQMGAAPGRGGKPPEKRTGKEDWHDATVQGPP